MKTIASVNSPKQHLIRYCCWILLLGVAVAGPPLQAAEPVYQLRVVTDPSDAIYEAGQEARFSIKVTHGAQPVTSGSVSYTVDDFITEYPPPNDYPQGTLDLDGEPKIVTVISEQPTFLRCRVTFRTPEGKTIAAFAAAGFSPLKIAPSLPVPEDFDQFWADQKKQLSEVPMEAKLAPVEQSNALMCKCPVWAERRSPATWACPRRPKRRAFQRFSGYTGLACAVRVWLTR